MAQEVNIIRIEVDQTSAAKELAAVRKSISELTKDRNELNKKIKEGNELTEQEIKDLGRVEKQLNEAKNNEREFTKTIQAQNNSLTQLRNRLSELTRERNDLDTSTKEGKKRFGELTDQIKKYSDNIKKAEEAGGDFRRSVGNYGKALDGISGPLGNAVAGVKNFAKQALAFIATPFGLVLLAISAAIYAVKRAFEDSEEGQNKYAKIMGVIGAIVGNLFDLLADLGEKIIEVFENPKDSFESFSKLFKENIENRFNGLLNLIPELGKAIRLLFEGEFAESAKTATNAVAQVTTGVTNYTEKVEQAIDAAKRFAKEQEKEASLAVQVANKRAEADKLERVLLVERAKLESNIAELKLKARQEEEFSAEQRKGFILEAQDLEDSLLVKEQEVLQLRSDAITLQNTFSRSNKENLKEEAELQARVLRAEAARLTQQKATQRELNRINKEIARDSAERAKAIAKETEDKIKEAAASELLAQQLIELERQRTEAALREFELRQSIRDREFQAQQDALDKEIEEADKALILYNKAQDDRTNKEAQEAARRAAIRQKETQQAISASADLFGTLAAQFDQASAEYKIFATGQATASFVSQLQNIVATNTAPSQPGNLATFGGAGAIASAIQIAAATAQFGANLALINRAAGGGDFVTTKPTMLLVGDNPGGRERVTVEPLSGRGQTKIHPGSGMVAMAGGGTLTAGSGTGIMSASREASSQFAQATALQQALRNMPAPVVSVKDINTVQGRVTVKDNISRI
jgi:DNA repair exonuclease SbcCD ATPase subunit